MGVDPLSPEAIADALNRALENDYDMTDMLPTLVALDMIECDADYDHLDAGKIPRALIEGIEKWQSGRRAA